MVTAINHAAIFIVNETKNLRFFEASKAVMYSSGDEMTSDTLKMDATKLSIYKKLRKIIADELGVEESEVTLNASFTNDLGADSLDTVELVIAWEKEFMISIPDRQFPILMRL